MNTLIRFILHHETSCEACSGSLQDVFERARLIGWGEHPSDAGGATMCGITLRTYAEYARTHRMFIAPGQPLPDNPSKEDLKAIPFDIWLRIFVDCFWARCRASEILSRPVAWIIVDWVWLSGPKVLKRLQKLIGVKADGIVGPATIAAINAAEPEQLFDRIYRSRLSYISEICASRPANKVFRTGWMRRLEHIHFTHLEYS